MNISGSFYGDLFQICDWNVAIFGFGKSRAARLAAGRPLERQLATDDLNLRRDNDVLLAALDLGLHGERDVRPRWHRVEAFVRCLRENETANFFKSGVPDIVPVDLEQFIHASRWNIGYPLTVENLEERLAERVPQFRSLVQGAVDELFIVPWLETVEVKAELLRSHFAQLRPTRGSERTGTKPA